MRYKWLFPLENIGPIMIDINEDDISKGKGISCYPYQDFRPQDSVTYSKFQPHNSLNINGIEVWKDITNIFEIIQNKFQIWSKLILNDIKMLTFKIVTFWPRRF